MGLYSLDEHRVKTPGAGKFWVADNAVVLGKVTIGEGASVWFNAVVRGDNDPIVIGPGTNIQDGSVLHADPGFPLTIGRDCTVGHMVMLHGCEIGDECLIGIGAIVLNGAKIGAQCLIGAGALIPEGKVIPPRSVVFGSPGKVAREVSEDNLVRMRSGADHYKNRWPKYVAGLKPQG
jgi:carbonic anhydrase/acetyltransferase-like protein (isoleucine patch superfamily)